MLINGQLVSQSAVQVWFLRGKVINEKKAAIDALADADFTVYPANAHAEQVGDFHVEFIRHPAEPVDNRIYLKVEHKGFGPVTIPLEVSQLKALYPDATIQGKIINLDHIVLPDPKGLDFPHEVPPALQLNPAQLTDYAAAARSAKPANPNAGGLPQ